jgi:hypothetical protein
MSKPLEYPGNQFYQKHYLPLFKAVRVFLKTEGALVEKVDYKYPVRMAMKFSFPGKNRPRNYHNDRAAFILRAFLGVPEHHQERGGFMWLKKKEVLVWDVSFKLEKEPSSFANISQNIGAILENENVETISVTTAFVSWRNTIEREINLPEGQNMNDPRISAKLMEDMFTSNSGQIAHGFNTVVESVVRDLRDNALI